MKQMTHQQLEAMIAKKASTFYKVKDAFEAVTKDVDMQRRTVRVVPNTYLYFDSDADVLLPGCAAKSIQERGVDSVGKGKIKNVKDHVISDRIGKPTVIDERVVDEKSILYAESKMLTTTLGDDTLIEYQEGVIDQHSIGFRYIDLELVTADDASWTKWLNSIINPKDAEDNGYLFLVKEIELFEWSPVSFGANQLSPYLGLKSANKEAALLKINSRLDLLTKQLKSGRQSDYAMMDYELETRQLKQLIEELFTAEPSIKDTLIKGRRKEDTHAEIVTCQSCLQDFDYTIVKEEGMGYVKCPNCGCYCDQKGNTVIPFNLDKAINDTKFLIF